MVLLCGKKSELRMKTANEGLNTEDTMVSQWKRSEILGVLCGKLSVLCGKKSLENENGE